MASSLNIETKIINGFAKGAGYKPGDIFKDTNHAWNVVKIDQNWNLIDCTWGAGTFSNNKFNRSLENFYFCARPS